MKTYINKCIICGTEIKTRQTMSSFRILCPICFNEMIDSKFYDEFFISIYDTYGLLIEDSICKYPNILYMVL